MPVDKSPKKPKLITPGDSSIRRIYWLNHIRTKREDGSLVELKPTPEQLAVAIAKCSRSSTPFDQNIDDVSLEKAAEFHERWVVGYGHASVAEHAVASVALEGIPQIIVKILEDCRLCSFTEVSSRYQVFTRNRVGLPETLVNSPYIKQVHELFDRLYNFYDECYALLEPYMQERTPKAEDMSDAAYKAVIKAMVCDRVRYLLPAAALANLGMTGNARNWEHAIKKLLSSNDPLAQRIGKEIKSVLRGPEHVDRDQALSHFPFPTLLKYADYNEYANKRPDEMQKLTQEILRDKNPNGTNPDRRVQCIFDDAMAERRIAAGLLAKHGEISMNQALNIVARDQKLEERLIKTALQSRGPHDAPPREFEHAWFEHEIVMDYGGWRDIQRHRMCTQSNQPLSTDLGFETPIEFEDIGKDGEFAEVMELAAAVNQKLREAGMNLEAEYVVPMAYRRRLHVGWNVRELFHFIELRSGKKGHPSYRRIAQELWKTLNETHPLIASFIRVDMSETGISTLGDKPKGF